MVEPIKPAEKFRWFGARKEGFNLFKPSRTWQLLGGDLRDAHGESHALSGSQWQGANLQDAYLNNTNLDGADLQGANLAGVKKLSCSQLVRAKYWQLAVFTAASKDACQRLSLPVNPSDHQPASQQRRLQGPELNGDPPSRHKLPHAPAAGSGCDCATASPAFSHRHQLPAPARPRSTAALRRLL
jgi:hypothetical protein